MESARFSLPASKYTSDPLGVPPKDNPEGFSNGGASEVGKWLWCKKRAVGEGGGRKNLRNGTCWKGVLIEDGEYVHDGGKDTDMSSLAM